MQARILIGFLLIAALTAITGYLHLAALRKRVQHAWSPLDAQLKRRHDRIPGLVKMAHRSAIHEGELLESITSLFQQAITAHSIPEQAEAENQLTQALAHLFTVAEAGADRETNQSLRALQAELTTAQDQIAFAGQFYNDQVMALNSKIGRFPWNIIAGPGGFHPSEYFVLDEPVERGAPPVAFPA